MTEPSRLTDLLLALETEAAAFYDALARRFADRPDLHALWSELARDEREHAKWIREAGDLSTGTEFPAALPKLRVAPLEAALDEVRQQRERVEQAPYTVVDALAATIALETSEVNDALGDFLAMTRALLPLEPLPAAMDAHLRRLTGAVERLSHPELTGLLKSVTSRAERVLGDRRTIMVVDDEVDMLETCARIFRRSGYTCLTAASGQDALALLKLVRADLILADLRMPRVDGLTLLRQAKRMAPEIPVVIFTAYVSEASARETLEAGAAAYLPKPFTASQLRSAVEQALGRGR
ncbi:MAG: response regulator [Candidatus Rokubacteria bacterium]|nr:response regulator [Candidatus Rokubacteria bacterium]